MCKRVFWIAITSNCTKKPAHIQVQTKALDDNFVNKINIRHSSRTTSAQIGSQRCQHRYRTVSKTRLSKTQHSSVNTPETEPQKSITGWPLSRNCKIPQDFPHNTRTQLAVIHVTNQRYNKHACLMPHTRSPKCEVTNNLTKFSRTIPRLLEKFSSQPSNSPNISVFFFWRRGRLAINVDDDSITTGVTTKAN